jgi:hypothetical protein
MVRLGIAEVVTSDNVVRLTAQNYGQEWTALKRKIAPCVEV